MSLGRGMCMDLPEGMNLGMGMCMDLPDGYVYEYEYEVTRHT